MSRRTARLIVAGEGGYLPAGPAGSDGRVGRAGLRQMRIRGWQAMPMVEQRGRPATSVQERQGWRTSVQAGAVAARIRASSIGTPTCRHEDNKVRKTPRVRGQIPRRGFDPPGLYPTRNDMAGGYPVMKRCSVWLMALCLAGCGTPRPPEGHPIADRHWGLRQLPGAKIRRSDREAATVRFQKDGHVDGTALCNSISTGLRWTSERNARAGAIANDRADPWIQTAVGCSPTPDDDLAGAFWDRMATARRWMLQGRALRIIFQDGSTAELVPTATPVARQAPGCADADPNDFDCHNRKRL